MSFYTDEQKAAAVEAVFRLNDLEGWEKGEKFRVAMESTQLREIAVALAVTPETVRDWCRNEALRPSGSYAGAIAAEPNGEAADVAMRDFAERHGTGGGIPSAMGAFGEWLSESAGGIMSEADRKDMVEALTGEGRRVSGVQRAMLAEWLRASLTPAEVIRRFLEWLCGREIQRVNFWRVSETTRTLADGWHYREEPEALPVIRAFPKLSRSRLVIIDPLGNEEILERAMVMRHKGKRVKIRRLELCKSLSSRAMCMDLAMLFSWMEGGAAQAEFAEKFAVRKQSINERVERLSGLMQGVGGFRLGERRAKH